MKSIPTQKNCCRTFGYSWRSLTSTLQTPLPLMGSCVHHTKKSRDKTHASYKQVYLHFDWSTDSRYRFLLHNSTRASAKYAFFIHVQKNQKPTNKKTKSVAVFTHNWYASASNRPTSAHPRPSCWLCGQHLLPRMAALSVKRGNPLALWKINTHPKQTGTTAGYLKPWTHQLLTNVSAPRERKNFEGIAKEKNQKCTKN